MLATDTKAAESTVGGRKQPGRAPEKLNAQLADGCVQLGSRTALCLALLRPGLGFAVVQLVLPGLLGIKSVP